MNLRTEARFWQLAGGIPVLGGFFLLVHTFSKFGLLSTETRATHLGMAASFIIVAGMVAFVTGRCLHAAEKKVSRLELFLWQVFGFAGVVLGGVFVLLVESKPPVIREERLLEGFAASMYVVLGLVCVLGQRAMTHMHQLGAAPEPEQKAQAAGGN